MDATAIHAYFKGLAEDAGALHVALWNNQKVNEDVIASFQKPAVFFEYEAQADPHMSGCTYYDYTVTVHILHRSLKEVPVERLAFVRAMIEAFDRVVPPGCNHTSTGNYNPGTDEDNVPHDTFTIEFSQQTIPALTGYILVDPPLTETDIQVVNQPNQYPLS